jgi:hypothetical protein
VLKILTTRDEYEKYKSIVESFDDYLEDWDYIITFDISEKDVAEKIADRLEVRVNVIYEVLDGTEFIVVYH